MDEVFKVVAEMTDDIDADYVALMWYEHRDGMQLVFWPMLLHKHEQGCNRA